MSGVSTEPFVDTNILLRHLVADHPDHSPRATAFLLRVQKGELRVRIADFVLLETVFTLERTYKHTKTDIAAALLPLIRLPGVLLPGKRNFETALDLYVRLCLPFADAYYAALMQHRGIAEIISFDKDFDRIPGITRREP